MISVIKISTELGNNFPIINQNIDKLQTTGISVRGLIIIDTRLRTYQKKVPTFVFLLVIYRECRRRRLLIRVWRATIYELRFSSNSTGPNLIRRPEPANDVIVARLKK